MIQRFAAYLNYSTFSQGSGAAQLEGRGVSLTVLPPLPLDFKFLDGRKADGHAPSENRGKASKTEDPLLEYYAQARADCEAQVSRAFSDPNSLAIYLCLVESRCIRFR